MDTERRGGTGRVLTCPEAKDDTVTDGENKARLTSGSEHEPNNAQTKADVRKRLVFSTAPCSLRHTDDISLRRLFFSLQLVRLTAADTFFSYSPDFLTARLPVAPGGVDPQLPTSLFGRPTLFTSRENPA